MSRVERIGDCTLFLGDCMELNYRVGGFELGLLGLFSAELVPQAIMTITDIGAYVIAMRQLRAELDPQPGKT